MTVDPTQELKNVLEQEGYEVIDLSKDSVRDGPVWECKIGLKKGTKVTLSGGADNPMRQAVEHCFYELTGLEADFCFSGWGAELTDSEQRVVDDDL